MATTKKDLMVKITPEAAQTLRDWAKRHKYVVLRGPKVGQGNISLFLETLARKIRNRENLNGEIPQ